MYDEAFMSMKRAAGVSEIEEVVHRFTAQKHTGKLLQELKNRAEKDIRDLGKIKKSLKKNMSVLS